MFLSFPHFSDAMQLWPRRLFSLLGLVVLTGCATNLKSVREFADETKKVAVAFGPFISTANMDCRSNSSIKYLYGQSDLSTFEVSQMDKISAASCKSFVEHNETAGGINASLVAYAEQLSALAGDGVPTQLNDSFESLAAKLNSFPDIPADKVNAASSLLKFLARTIIIQQQRREIEAMLSHEDAFATLADAMVTYVARVNQSYVKQAKFDIETTVLALKQGKTGTLPVPELVGKLQIVELRKRTAQMDEQEKSIESFKNAVAQVKKTMSDLRANLGSLSDKERRLEVESLVKEVRALYAQLNKSF
jgi:uncharacterized coiled-coil protein SlyX